MTRSGMRRAIAMAVCAGTLGACVEEQRRDDDGLDAADAPDLPDLPDLVGEVGDPADGLGDGALYNDTEAPTDGDDSVAGDDTESPREVDDAEDIATEEASEDTPRSEADVADEIRVIDPTGDSDHDGILDRDEVSDLTDPFDPRSARAWHPELATQPRLFVTPADREAMRARITATAGADKVLWDRIVALAAQTPPAQPDAAPGVDYVTAIGPTQGRIAEAAAARAWIEGDPAMGVKALTILAAPFPDPTPLNARSAFNAGDHYDLFEAETLVPMCSAWDLLAGDAALYAPGLVAAARDRLTRRIDYFRGLCFDHGGCSSLLHNEPNNHASKALSALGVCAMSLSDRPEAAGDFSEAVAGLRWIFDEAQGELEGGWAESWNYLSYAGESHLPFLLAMHHTARGARWSVRGLGWVTWRDPRNGTAQDGLDFAADPTLIAVYQRALFATTPDGRTPPVDDANTSTLHGGALASLFHDGRFLWNWELPAVGRATGQVLVPTFLAYDATLAPTAPDWPLDGFLPMAGFSVLRSDLGTDALYVHVQHEQDRMRTMGGAHEHADPLSFVLYAFGEPLAIDPGYIDFTRHALVKYGKDHNIVLVDGQGPEFFLDGLVDLAPNSDAFLHAHGALGPHTTLIASTKYAGAELRRRFVRLGQRALVVADALVADGVHGYRWQLNGYASELMGGTSFTRLEAPLGTASARWQRPLGGLVATVIAAESDPAAAAEDRLEESQGVQGLGQHRCLTLTASMGARAGFVAILLPYRESAAIGLESGRGPEGVAWVRVGDDVAILNRAAASTSVTLANMPRAAPPGLTILDLATGDAWTATMDTPPIPDPAPFIPE